MKANYKDAVDNKDVNTVRIALSSELMKDPSGDSFLEMLNYAEKYLNNLYEIDNGNFQEKPSSEWNQDYLFDLKNKLLFNFSKQKLIHYEKVVKEVYKEKAENSSHNDNPNDKIDSINPHSGKKQPTHKKSSVYKGVAAGGAVIAVAGLITSKTVITVAGLATLATGCYLLYKESKK
ncbi:MAG: hypothetical protein J5711_02295 [Bacteroidales bacterium]|nr:hypothetical protein [Bacteroidales bacterium]